MHCIFTFFIVFFALSNAAPPSTTTGSDGKPLRGAALRAKKNKVPGAPADHPFTKKPRELASIFEINTALGLDEIFWEGDQDVNTAQLKEIFGLEDPAGQTTPSPRGKRQTMVDSQYPTDTWTQGVPYYFDPSLPATRVAAVQTAIGFWQANTCVRFTQVSSPSASTIKPVVRFYNGTGCNSPIGRNTNPSTVTQDISLGDGCDPPGIAAHEIGHSLGMYHGQSRYDRDSWISINSSNIQPAKLFNFNAANSTTNNNYGMRYDYRSIMHYEPYSFAINQSAPVMNAYDWLAQYSMGASRMPVFTDIALINYEYKCYDRCSSAGTVCYHGGMPNPNNCTVCQCPSGFAGKDCSYIESPNGVVGSCGGLLTPTANWTDLKVTNQIGNGVWAASTVQANCTWHILAPSGKFVQFYVKFVGANGSNSTHCSSDCYWGGVDIKWDANKQPEGYRICCPDSYYWMNQSGNNLLIVQAYNFWFYTDFTLAYRIEKFGYIDDATEPYSVRTGAFYREKIKELQEMLVLPITGTIDEETKRVMSAPRCGVPDPTKVERNRRTAAYNYKWLKKRLTYWIKNNPASMTNTNEVHREIAKAFKVWQEVADISFKEKKSADGRDVDMSISFELRQHGDDKPFDEQILAHAFWLALIPPYAVVHFNYDQEFKSNPRDQTEFSLLSVAIHQIGHAIGLHHSNKKDSVMFPLSIHTTTNLSTNDIASVQALYGPISSQIIRSRTGELPPDPCDGHIDAATMIGGDVYMFKGEWFWTFNGDELTGNPSLVKTAWPEIEGDVDSVLTYNGYEYFFVEDKIFVFSSDGRLFAKQNLTDYGIPADVKKIRLAFLWYHGDRPILYMWAEKTTYTYDVHAKATSQNPITDDWADATANLDMNGDNYIFTRRGIHKFDKTTYYYHEPVPFTQMFHC
ncbi:hypothetical protein QR680_015556 [Steinernema hermaphroditum]|uniref:Metalloendopeptidase n=1 Tax=Steinernema hermaphroditum TaxID=289476 RepID=A0AA39H995_9BILA|nr:hypothetical protein QR680_015556 [Steinernema hermaphroditum]